MMDVVAKYRAMPYTRRATPVDDESGHYWLAWVEEIPWIRIHGDTKEHAHKRLLDVFDDCVQSMIDAGDHVPEPKPYTERW